MVVPCNNNKSKNLEELEDKSSKLGNNNSRNNFKSLMNLATFSWFPVRNAEEIFKVIEFKNTSQFVRQINQQEKLSTKENQK